MKRVLVVDDSRTCRQMYRRELARGGYEVLEAADGLEAIDCVHHNEVDLVVLDIEMPNMDGYEVCERLRSKEFSSRFFQKRDGVLPIVFVTASDSPEVRQKGFDLGANDFISKGFKKGVLRRTVDNILDPDNVLSGMCALVVDDSRTQRNMVGRILEMKGVSVISAADGAEAYDIMCRERDRVGMVITDLEMPRMTGDVLCRRLRKDLGLARLPIIIITATDNREKLLQLFSAGASDYLMKPFENEELIARLKASLMTIESIERVIEQRVRRESAEMRNEEIIAQARVAGEAEIATSVLHNIGNVLNSVYASCYQIQRQLKGSRVRQISMAHQMIFRNIDRIDTFFKEDPRGKLLPDYLLKGGEKLTSEQSVMAKEVDEILTRIDLMRDIIETQQAHARGHSLIEPMPLVELLDEAIKVLEPSLEKYGIELVREVEPLPPVPVERVSLVHVLINLIKNAVEAMRRRPERVLTCRLLEQGSIPTLVIQDTGSGITAENLDQIFTHGFTTKQDGHGFGLAFCVRAIEAMGGTLSAESEGEGKGATFTLQLDVPATER